MPRDLEQLLHDTALEPTQRPDPTELIARGRGRRRTRHLLTGLGSAAVATLIALAAATLASGPGPEPPEVVNPPAPRNTEQPSPTESPTGDAGVGSWAPMADGPLGPRSDAASVWTGDEVFIWGGWLTDPDGPAGAMFDPARNQWSPIAAAPDGWVGTGVAVWTGRDVLVLGSERYDDEAHQTVPSMQLLAYDPDTDSWRTYDAPPLAPRTAASVTWTGDELIVWGGRNIRWDRTGEGPTPVEMFADGAAFDPDSGSWRVLADSPLAPRGDHGAVWNGRRLIVFGGGATDQFESEFSWFDLRHDAAVYDPATDSWSTIASPDRIGPLVGAHWTGERIVYWTGHLGEQAPGSWLPPGAVWDPATGDWEPMTTPPFLQRRDSTVTVWADELEAMITWGGAIGEGGNRHFPDGAAYDPDTNSWQPLAGADLGARAGHIAAWTGDQLIIWGGIDDGSEADGVPGVSSQPRADGAAWQP